MTNYSIWIVIYAWISLKWLSKFLVSLRVLICISVYDVKAFILINPVSLFLESTNLIILVHENQASLNVVWTAWLTVLSNLLCDNLEMRSSHLLLIPLKFGVLLILSLLLYSALYINNVFDKPLIFSSNLYYFIPLLWTHSLFRFLEYDQGVIMLRCMIRGCVSNLWRRSDIISWRMVLREQFCSLEDWAAQLALSISRYIILWGLLLRKEVEICHNVVLILAIELSLFDFLQSILMNNELSKFISWEKVRLILT